MSYFLGEATPNKPRLMKVLWQTPWVPNGWKPEKNAQPNRRNIHPKPPIFYGFKMLVFSRGCSDIWEEPSECLKKKHVKWCGMYSLRPLHFGETLSLKKADLPWPTRWNKQHQRQQGSNLLANWSVFKQTQRKFHSWDVWNTDVCVCVWTMPHHLERQENL